MLPPKKVNVGMIQFIDDDPPAVCTAQVVFRSGGYRNGRPTNSHRAKAVNRPRATVPSDIFIIVLDDPLPREGNYLTVLFDGGKVALGIGNGSGGKGSKIRAL